MSEQYRQHDLEEPETFDALSEFYPRHIDAMTKENLHCKSDIAWEFSSRDSQIAILESECNALKAKLDKIVELCETSEDYDELGYKTEEIIGEG